MEPLSLISSFLGPCFQDGNAVELGEPPIAILQEDVHDGPTCVALSIYSPGRRLLLYHEALQPKSH